MSGGRNADTGPHPSAGYAICCSPRSGSNYLCELLSSTDSLGRPGEHFSARSQKHFRPEGYSFDPVEQLARVLEDGATANGIYGLKIFPFQFDALNSFPWSRGLPGLKYVFLTRADLLGQALSFVRANQTRQWRGGHARASVVYYDRRAISRCLVAFSQEEARWRTYFARNAIETLRLDYESVVARPQAAVDAVARLVGLAETVPIDWERVTLQVQRDGDTDMWRRRFLEEEGDRHRLDSLDPLVLRLIRSAARRLNPALSRIAENPR